jgi:hypothetical protein
VMGWLCSDLVFSMEVFLLRYFIFTDHSNPTKQRIGARTAGSSNGASDIETREESEERSWFCEPQMLSY